MKTIPYNNESYDVEVKLSRLNDKGDFVNDVEFVMDNVAELHIINDLTHPLLRMALILQDPSSHVSPKYALDGRTYFNIKIYYTTNQGKKDKVHELLKFEHNFIVNDIQIVDKQPDSGTYRYLGVSELVIPWLNKVYYSTNNHPKQITKIIKDIFGNSVLKNKFECYNSSGKDFVHTPITGEYITPVNHSLQDCIFPLLISSHNYNTGMYGIAYNMLKDKIRLLSFSDEFKNNIIKDFNGIKIPSKYKFSDTEAMPKNEKMFNFIRCINQYDRLSTVTVNDFDYVHRQWTKDLHNYKKLDNFLPKTSKNVDGNFETLFQPISDRYQNIKFNIEEVSNFPFDINQRMEEYFKFAQVLQFSYVGYLARDVGDLFKVQADQEDTYDNREAGTWMVTRIHHVFSNNKYDQNISLIRSDKKKELFKKKVVNVRG